MIFFPPLPVCHRVLSLAGDYGTLQPNTVADTKDNTTQAPELIIAPTSAFQLVL